MAAIPGYSHSGHHEFIIPESAVDGMVVAAGLVTGILGWNYQDKPVGRILLGAGGGLAALGIGFLIRGLFKKDLS